MNAREQEFVYDEVLDGKIANKEVYVKVARAHVNAAMEGYNSVVFAYGQTCSGKTFTLVSCNLCWHPCSLPFAALSTPRHTEL
jgi:hypothetical protein